MWQQISAVSSGVTLVAFLIAAGVYAYRSRLHQQAKLIESASEADRGKIVEQTLEFFAVDTAGLSKSQRYDLAVQQIRSRERRYFVGAILVFGLAVVAGVIVGVAVIMDPKTPKPPKEKAVGIIPTPTPVKVAPALVDGGPLSVEQLKADGWVSNTRNDGVWILVIHLTAKFSNERYNRAAYHRSISDVRVAGVRSELLSEADYRVEPPVALNVSSVQPNEVHPQAPDRVEESRGVLYLDFRRLPTATDTFTFYTAARKWTIPIGSRDWIQMEGKKWDGAVRKWSVAQATLSLSLEDPDWVVASHTRILERADRSGTMLEVSLESQSENLESLSTAVIEAVRYTNAHGKGIVGPQWQEVELDWGAMTPLPDGSNEVEAATQLNNQKIRIAARFRPGNLEGYHDRIVIPIPLQLDLSPKQATRVLLAVTDKLPAPMGRTLRAGLTSIRVDYPLSRWDDVQIRFDPPGKVFPSVLQVKKRGAPTSDM
jgi:hypothetical protein